MHEQKVRNPVEWAQLPLRIAVSTRTLFDLEAEHAVFEVEGVSAYVDRQRALESSRLTKGPGFEAVAHLLGLNQPDEPKVVEVILVSRNAPEMSLRAFAAVKDHGLAIATGSFTNGRPVAPFLLAWGVDLFLSNDAADVEAATAAGIAAAKFGTRPTAREEKTQDLEFRIAFDGDAVVFSDASDEIFAREGLQAFLFHETQNAAVPMTEGPFGPLLHKFAALKKRCEADGCRRIRTALVTARSAPTHARAMLTLRSWGTPVDEAHFVGDGDKAPILEAFGAHVFFDDQERHVVAASQRVASARVPGRSGFANRLPEPAVREAASAPVVRPVTQTLPHNRDQLGSTHT